MKSKFNYKQEKKVKMFILKPFYSKHQQNIGSMFCFLKQLVEKYIDFKNEWVEKLYFEDIPSVTQSEQF